MTSEEAELLQAIRQKFISGNSIPVERITITRKEYELIFMQAPNVQFVRPPSFLEGLTIEVIESSIKEAEWKSGLYRMLSYEEILAETIKAKLLENT